MLIAGKYEDDILTVLCEEGKWSMKRFRCGNVDYSLLDISFSEMEDLVSGTEFSGHLK